MNLAKNFIEKVETKRSGENIFLVTGGKDKLSREAWYYIQVDKIKTNLFQKNIKLGKVNLGEFGKIIHSGFGINPPEEIKKIMKEKYNFGE